MPAAFGSSVGITVVGVWVALTDTLDVAGASVEGGHVSGTYLLHVYCLQQSATQRLKETPVTFSALAQALVLLQLASLKHSLMATKVPFINSAVAAKQLSEKIND